jgi:hypothetical protein
MTEYSVIKGSHEPLAPLVGPARRACRPALGLYAGPRFTGKAQPGQAPLFSLTGPQWWAVNSLILVLSVIANIAILGTLPVAGAWTPAAVVASFYLLVFTTGALRNSQVTFAHHAIHGTLFANAALNRFAACLATIIPLAQNETAYRADHVGLHHNRKTFTTPLDADEAFLIKLGFYAGMPKREAWRLFITTLLSPKFHYDLTVIRLKSALVDASWKHRGAAIAWLAVLAGLASTMPAWVFTVAVLLPLGPLYGASALTQFASEHAWLITPDGPGKDNIAYAQRCVARFCASPRPARELRGIPAALAWAAWVAELLLVHVPVRFGVLVGDLTVHSFHHTAPFAGFDTRNWPDAVFERQAALDQGHAVVVAEAEAWGIVQALDWVFDGISKAQPLPSL